MIPGRPKTAAGLVANPGDEAGRGGPRYRRGGYATIAQRRDRLAERAAELWLWRDRAVTDLGGWTFDGAPLALGAPWPDRRGVRRLAAGGITVPADWPLAQARLDLALGGEGLLHITGPDGQDRRGLDPNHGRFPLPGRHVDLAVDIVARFPFGEPNRAPRLERARLAWADLVVERLARLLDLVVEATDVLGDDPADALLHAAERALAGLDWPSRTADYVARAVAAPALQAIWELPEGLDPAPPGLSDAERASAARACDVLAAELAAARTAYPPRGDLLLTGHAHLDLAWLWPVSETRRKALRTGWTAIGLLGEYPEFRFSQSSAQLYTFIEQDDPELLRRIQQAVAAGQWEPVGGMWVEADGNLPCGESLARQLLHGQRAFARWFGAASQAGWLPDTFGFSPGLPQLLASAGIEGLFAQKLNRADTNQFPHDLYWWEGLDGTRLLVHGFDNPHGSYDAMLGPDAFARTWANYRGKDTHPQSLLSVGFGDGGGGPTAEMIEKGRLLDGFPALPRAAFGSVADLFARMRDTAGRAELPVWTGELYLEFHRGTYTAQGRLKRLHRRAERDLVAAEVLGVLCALAGGSSVQHDLTAQWQALLLCQFHDILPGSSIREVNAAAEDQLAGVIGAAAKASAEHLATLRSLLADGGGQPGLLVVNPDLSERPLRAEVSSELPGAQPVDGGLFAVATREAVAGLEARVVTDFAAAPGLSASARHLENELVRVELDDSGALASVWDKRAGREVLAGRGNQLWAYPDKPRVYDAWELDESYAGAGQELGAPESVELAEAGPHRAAIRVRRRFRSSVIVQDLRLWANSPRIDFRTVIDWHDRRWLLKTRFPLAVRADRAAFETAFGVVYRPTHRNTSWDAARFEVPGHRFADLSEPGYGAALLNDGRYGYHAADGELGLSLLRSPVYPDPLADEGRHELTYALLPHPGDWHEAGVLAEAEDLNSPLLTAPAPGGRPRSTAPPPGHRPATGPRRPEARRGRRRLRAALLRAPRRPRPGRGRDAARLVAGRRAGHPGTPVGSPGPVVHALPGPYLAAAPPMRNGFSRRLPLY